MFLKILLWNGNMYSVFYAAKYFWQDQIHFGVMDINQNKKDEQKMKFYSKKLISKCFWQESKGRDMFWKLSSAKVPNSLIITLLCNV